jgi:hypothetical protein
VEVEIWGTLSKIFRPRDNSQRRISSGAWSLNWSPLFTDVITVLMRRKLPANTHPWKFWRRVSIRYGHLITDELASGFELLTALRWPLLRS